MPLDDIRPVDLPDVGSRAPLINAEQWRQIIQRAPVDVERIGQEFANRRTPACYVDGLIISCLKEQLVGLFTCVGIAPEESSDVALQPDREDGHRRSFSESAKRQIHERVLDAALSNGSPLTFTRHAADQGKCVFQ